MSSPIIKQICQVVVVVMTAVPGLSGSFPCLSICRCHYVCYSSVRTNFFFFVSQTVRIKYAVIDTSLEFAGTLTKDKVFGTHDLSRPLACWDLKSGKYAPLFFLPKKYYFGYRIEES